MSTVIGAAAMSPEADEQPPARGLSQRAKRSMRNLIGSVLPSTSVMKSLVATFFSCDVFDPVFTSANPSFLAPTFTVMR